MRIQIEISSSDNLVLWGWEGPMVAKADPQEYSYVLEPSYPKSNRVTVRILEGDPGSEWSRRYGMSIDGVE